VGFSAHKDEAATLPQNARIQLPVDTVSYCRKTTLAQLDFHD